jgi:hypothetical protein
MFSGSFIMKDVINGYAEGANYFIPKPTDLESLVELVSAADKGLATDPINCEALARFATPPAPK